MKVHNKALHFDRIPLSLHAASEISRYVQGKGGEMGWLIKCYNTDCGEETWASNIVDLIQNHCNEYGWFKCASCGSEGYIEKSFDLQEPGETWEPYLKGIIPLGEVGDTYMPFVFLVSYSPNEPPNDVWFSYYKDTRSIGGRLKLGYGPGGPPVLGIEQLIQLIKKLIERGCLNSTKIKEGNPPS
jgi:hypothetical protein